MVLLCIGGKAVGRAAVTWTYNRQGSIDNSLKRLIVVVEQ